MRDPQARKVINYSPLHENQNWLFDVVYDRTVFETQTVTVNLKLENSSEPTPIPLQIGPSGNATSVYQIALQVLGRMMKGNTNASFVIGRRSNRIVSLVQGAEIIVPNIFQLSSGETSLLNLFLSVLRDFDLSGSPITTAAEITGIVLVDEVDLHLHSTQQHEVLPNLMQMFPKVQFIVTTHSPLFVLGMAQAYGEDGFALYRMPQGHQISSEEFTEFEDAYSTFTTTSAFSDDIRAAIQNAQNPFLYVEGTTDGKYVRRAAQLLDKEGVLNGVEIKDGKGIPGLKNIWGAVSKLSDDIVSRKTALLFDCDYEGPSVTQGNKHRLTIPRQNDHPIEKGIENLFDRETLKRVLSHKPEFIDVVDTHQIKVRGQMKIVLEKWVVNQDEKTNLCNWLCENGTVDDFRHFHVIFDLLQEFLGNSKSEGCNSE